MLTWNITFEIISPSNSCDIKELSVVLLKFCN